MKKQVKKDILLELSKTNGLKKLELNQVVGGLKRDQAPPPPETWEDTGNACDPDRPNA